jgi:hypothetical protein
MSDTRITLIGRPGCHLCDDARAVVEQVAGELGVGWEERSIEDDAELRAQWADHIPVTLVDGRPHDFFRVSPERLRSALKRAPRPGDPPRG